MVNNYWLNCICARDELVIRYIGKMKKIFIIDFDSTFIKSEGLEELAAIVLNNNPQKIKILKGIKSITDKGMNGEIPFDISLSERISLLNPCRRDVERLGDFLKNNVSDSINKNKKFFSENKDRIFVISGGFKDFILPVVNYFGIREDHVFANTFIFDDKGNYKGYDKDNLLAQNDGKVKLVNFLKKEGRFPIDAFVYVIGDGYTDYKLKELGLVDKFVAFTENIERDFVRKKADEVVSNFDDFLYNNKLNMDLSFPKNKINVLLTENIDLSAVRHLEKEGYSVEHVNRGLTEEELIERIGNVHILGTRSRTQVNRQVLAAAPKLLVSGAFCIGTNQIDLKTASAQGVAVFNAPFSNTRSVVELIIGEIIALSRKIVEKNNDMHKGIWSKTAKDMHEVRGRTLGIVGYGNIGSQLSVLAESLGMSVVYYDVIEKMALGNAKSCSTLAELFKKSDIISIHVDGNARNRNLIGEKEFEAMKDGVIFLNASRGFIVDTDAFIRYVKNGKIGGAGIDVFPLEPKSRDESFVSELKQFPNVILTPHIGGSTEEAQGSIADFVSTKIIDFINTGNTSLCVNLPNIHIQKQNDTHRLLHLHKNVPGVLAQINSILAKGGLNITGQYLKTNEEIGYVITDVNKEYDEDVLKELKKMKNTIRFRVLY